MLHTCPDCGKQYSTKAKICPNCGRPNDVFLESVDSWLKKQNAQLACDMNIEAAKQQLKVSLIYLAVAIVFSYIFVHLTGQNQEIHDFRALVLVYLVPMISIFYIGVVRSFFGFSWLFGIIFYIAMIIIMVKLLGEMPDLFALMITLIWLFIPLYLLIFRPVISLIRIGKNKVKKDAIKNSEEDLYVQKMHNGDLL